MLLATAFLIKGVSNCKVILWQVKLEEQIFGIDNIVWNSLGDARYIRPPDFLAAQAKKGH